MTDKKPDGRLVSLAESDALRSLPAKTIDAQALIVKAIESGASVETLERLVTLAKDLRAIMAKEAFNDAIAEFQRRCPVIKKNKTMMVPGRPEYKYGDLGEILSTIAPLMGELGLSVSWRTMPPTTTFPAVVQVCVISHRLGHEKESGAFVIPYRSEDNRMNPAQTVGSAITYAKRYSLCSALGISPEDDTDASDTDMRGGDAPPRTHGTSKTKTNTAPTAPSPGSVDPGEAPDTSQEMQERQRLIALIEPEVTAHPARLTRIMHTFNFGEFDKDDKDSWQNLDVAALDTIVKHLFPEKKA